MKFLYKIVFPGKLNRKINVWNIYNNIIARIVSHSKIKYFSYGLICGYLFPNIHFDQKPTIYADQLLDKLEYYAVYLLKQLSSYEFFHEIGLFDYLVYLNSMNTNNELLSNIYLKVIALMQFPKAIYLDNMVDKLPLDTFINLLTNESFSQSPLCKEIIFSIKSKTSNNRLKSTEIDAKIKKLTSKLQRDKIDLCGQWLCSLYFDQSEYDFLNGLKKHSNWDDINEFNISYKKYTNDSYNDKKFSFLLNLIGRLLKNEYNRQMFIKYDGIKLLSNILRLFRDDLSINILISSLLLNLTIDKTIEIGEFLEIIPYIYDWKRSDSNHLKSYALSNISNLNRTSKNECLFDSNILLFNSSEESDFDLVFVHGIGGNHFGTWRSDSDPSICWPIDWIPRDIKNSRVLSLGFDSNFLKWQMDCPQNVFDFKTQSDYLLQSLINAGCGKKPIIWITHSLGGLLVKHILMNSNNLNIINQTKAIVFFSVPHYGAPYANHLKYMIPAFNVEYLVQGAEYFTQENISFIELLKQKNIECLCFSENKPTPVVPLTKLHIIPIESSNLKYGNHIIIDKDHINVCKPSDISDPIYNESILLIKRTIN